VTEYVAPSEIDDVVMRAYEHVVTLARQYEFSLLLDATPRFHDDEVYPRGIKARAEAFYCGLAKAHRQVLYARLSHAGGIDRDASLYRDGGHFNMLGARKMSEMISHYYLRSR
jgi:lysophospholipase L1-like esterase